MLLPGLEDVEGFSVMGLLSRIDDDGSELDDVWNAFAQVRNAVASHSTDAACYGISFATEEDGRVDYLAGMAVPPGTQPPEGMVVRELPAALYAQFDCRFHELADTIQGARQEWLPSSPYAPDPNAPVADYLRLPAGELNAQAMVSYFFPIVDR